MIIPYFSKANTLHMEVVGVGGGIQNLVIYYIHTYIHTGGEDLP